MIAVTTAVRLKIAVKIWRWRESFGSFSLGEHVAAAVVATIFVPLAVYDDTTQRCWDVFVVVVQHVLLW